MNTNSINGRRLRRSLLAVALLGVLSAPAFADDACWIWNGSAWVPNPALDTNQGNEQGDNNATCSTDASAYGERNTANAVGSSAIGDYNFAIGIYSQALGSYNAADEQGSTAIGHRNNFLDGNTLAERSHAPAGHLSTAVGFRNLSSGIASSAVGYENVASGDPTFKSYNIVNGQYFYVETDGGAQAFGARNKALGDHSSAFGISNEAGRVANAFGQGNKALGQLASAFGAYNTARGSGSNVFGYQSVANGVLANAFGYRAAAAGSNSLALSSTYDKDGNRYSYNDMDLDGDGINDASSEAAVAAGASSVAVGAAVVALGDASTAIGVDNRADGKESFAAGFGNNVAFPDGTTMLPSGEFSTAVGHRNSSAGSGSSAIGFVNAASGRSSAAFGFFNTASAESSVAFGNANQALGWRSNAFGNESRAQADTSTAIGFRAVATEAGTVSFGHSIGDADVWGGAHTDEWNSRLVHVADGIADTDAVNLRQLNAMIGGIGGFDPSAIVDAFGGGAAWAGGVFTAPTYIIRGDSHSSVGAAFAAVDTQLGALADADAQTLVDANAHADAGDFLTLTAANAYTDDKVANAAGAALDDAKAYADAGDAATLDAAQDYADAGDAATLDAANAYTDGKVAEAAGAVLDEARDYADVGDAATLQSANAYADTRETAIRTDMANGDAATLTASRSYTDTKSVQTLASANAYTDNKFAVWNDAFIQYQQQVDRRFVQTDARIDRSGAMQTAMAQMTASAAGIRTLNRMAVGVGAQNGKTALSIGYQRAIGERAAFTIGGAFSGDERSAGVGYGFGW